jgi:hypothetical protein
VEHGEQTEPCMQVGLADFEQGGRGGGEEGIEGVSPLWSCDEGAERRRDREHQMEVRDR